MEVKLWRNENKKLFKFSTLKYETVLNGYKRSIWINVLSYTIWMDFKW